MTTYRRALHRASEIVYRIAPLHDMAAAGAPVTGYRLERLGYGIDDRGTATVGPTLTLRRFDTRDDARAAVAHLPARSIDDETR